MRLQDEIKSKFKNNVHMAMVNIYYTNNYLRDKNMSLYKKYDLLPQHYNVLRIVKGKHPKPVYPGDIKEVLIDKGNDLTRLIDKMVQKGLLDRRLCESNRRKMEINITPKGIKIAEDISAEMEVHLKDLNLTEEEAGTLSELLDKIRS